MSSHYTRLLKDDVIRLWLSGKRRDTIAIENGLSTGSVSNIVHEWEAQIGNLAAYEIREFGIILRKSDLTPAQCAKGFRIANIIHDLGFAEDDVEKFLRDIYKMCKNIGLQPDKIAFHIKDLVGLTDKVPLNELSDYIRRNSAIVEGSRKELERVTTQLKNTRTELDKSFSKYKADVSEVRWTHWLKEELTERGLEFNSITALVNAVEDVHAFGFDARKIISKFSEIDDLEIRTNALKSEISKLIIDKEKEIRQLAMLKRFSSTHRQALDIYGQLDSMGFRLPELTIMYNTIKELANENGFTVSTAVSKFIEDITTHYSSVSGFESRLEGLKNEIEDTELGMAMLRSSETELDNVMSSLRKLWARGITSEDIINLAESHCDRPINKIVQDSKTINCEILSTDQNEYRNLESDIEKLNIKKSELVVEIGNLTSLKQWLEATIIMPLTFRVIQYYSFITRISICMRIYVQVNALYLIYKDLRTTQTAQELDVDKLSISSERYRKLLPLINSIHGENIEFSEIKSALISAIEICIDKLASSNDQNTNNDNSNINAMIAVLDHTKLALEQVQ
ncbi:MAG TPA: hypothetical protein VH500_04305 [Nitrososphaeraceae archaeon]|jgi:exonuclease VII small subunit